MRVGQSGSNNQVQSAETSAAKKSGKAQNAQAAKAGDAKAAESSGASIEGANASISSKARDFAKAKEVAAGAPDVREEKIAELKRRIASGQYSVDANAVADKLVDSHLQTAAMG